MDPAGLPALLDAIRDQHGCAARWVESVHVHEKLPDGRTLWEGEVQVLELVGHPKASLAYAWSHGGQGSERRFHSVLGIYPVDGPVMAVRTAILAQVRESKRPKA